MSLKRLRPEDLRVGLRARSMRGKRARVGDLVVVSGTGRDIGVRDVKRKRSKAMTLLDFPQEVKFFDTAVSFTFDSTAEVPATGQWSLIPQGDTQSTRDGRLAIIKSVQFRGYVTGPTTASLTLSPLMYVWVILDKQANGAAAAVTDVFTSTSAASMLLNLNNSGRFRILHKEVISPAGEGLNLGTAASTSYNRAVEFFLPNLNIKMDWDSTTGAITEIKSNNIFIIAGTTGGGVDDEYTFTGNARLRFVG